MNSGNSGGIFLLYDVIIKCMFRNIMQLPFKFKYVNCLALSRVFTEYSSMNKSN